MNADAVTISPTMALRAAGEDKALFALVRTAGRVRRRCRTSWPEIVACFGGGRADGPPGAGIMAQTDYSLDVRGAAAAVEGCLPSAGRLRRRSCQLCLRRFRPGAMVIDDSLQYAEDVPAAMDDAIREMEALGHGGVTRIPTKEKL